MGEHYPVVPRELATQDLRDAAAHYAADVDAATARRFIDAAERAFTLIARQPGLGSPRYAVELDWLGLRTCPIERFPYLVFYLEQADQLDVLRVLHAHRDIPPACSTLLLGDELYSPAGVALARSGVGVLGSGVGSLGPAL